MISEQDQWLGVVRPLLSGIRHDAHWIKHYCAAIKDKVNRLPNKPSFDTLAEDEIVKAALLLREATAYLQEAKEAFNSKPVERKQCDV